MNVLGRMGQGVVVLALVATTGCFKWGDIKHQDAFKEAGNTLKCKGTVTGDVTTTFYCDPRIIEPHQQKATAEESLNASPEVRQAWEIDGDAGMLFAGILFPQKMDPAGNVRGIIALIATVKHNENNRLVTGPDFEVGQIYGTVAGAKADLLGRIDLSDATGRQFNRNGWLTHLHHSEGETAHWLDEAPGYSTKLVLTDIFTIQPVPPKTKTEIGTHGTFDATLVEATDNGAGPGRAKLHIEF